LGSRGRRPNRDGRIDCLKKLAQAPNFARSQRHWHRSGLGIEGFLGDGNEGLARFWGAMVLRLGWAERRQEIGSPTCDIQQ
jgi:hypothetical protein